VYGAPPKQTDNSAGAIIPFEARLLLFPVRSLTSQFKWVTCPSALWRYKEDSKRLGLSVDFELPELNSNSLGENQAIIDSEEGSLFLEEYRFETQKKDLSKFITALAQLMQRDDAEQALKKQLVIVSDDSFTHLVNHATPVNAHNVLDSLTKTSENLWYEETLPSETLLYIGLSANASRKENDEQSAADILKRVLNLFATTPYLQVGGNETVGMGWCIIKQLLQQKGA